MGAVKRVKNVEWEKNRRERLNLTFLELSRLLPEHDPTLTLTKLEILNKSISYIKDLRERNSSLLGANNNEVFEAEMTSLREQVDDLQRRNQQLAELLHTAKIPLPPRPLRHTTPLTCPRKWEGKLSSEAVTGLRKANETKSVEMKENPKHSIEQPKLSTKKKSVKNKKNSKNKVDKHSNSKSSKSEISVINSLNNPLRELNNTLSVASVSEPGALSSLGNLTRIVNAPKVQSAPPPFQTTGKVPLCSVKSATVAGPTVTSVQSTLVLTRTVTLPRTTISLVLSNSKASVVTVAKSNVLPTPIMATGIQPVLQCNPSLSSLGPGTLIMPGGRIVPVPPPPTVLAPTLILLPPTTAVSVPTPVPTRSPHKPNNCLRPIVPKPRHRDITQTTFANKVPIPAISTHRHKLFLEAKTSQNNHSVSLVKKDVKKKSVVTRPNVKEKCFSVQTTTLTSKSSRIVLTDKSLISHSNQESVVDSCKSLSDNKVSNSSAIGKNKNIKRITKRKCETVNENTPGPKIAKVVCTLDESIVSSADSKKSDHDFNSLQNVQKPQETGTADLGSVDGISSSKWHGNISKQNELFRPTEKQISIAILESNKNPHIAEHVLSPEISPSMGIAVENRNQIEEDSVSCKKKDDVTAGNMPDDSVSFVSGKAQTQSMDMNSKNLETNVVEHIFVNDNLKDNLQTEIRNINNQNTETNVVENLVANNDKKDSSETQNTNARFQNADMHVVKTKTLVVNNSQKDDSHKHTEVNYHTAIPGVPVLDQKSCLIANKTLSKEGVNLKENTHQISQSHVGDDPAKREKPDVIKPALLDYKNDQNKNVNPSAQTLYSNVGIASKQTLQTNLQVDTQQNSKTSASNNAKTNDSNQHAKTTSISLGNPTKKVIDSSTQITSDFGMSKSEPVNQNRSHHKSNTKATLVIKNSSSTTSDEKIQVLNVNQNINKKDSENQIPVGDCFGMLTNNNPQTVKPESSNTSGDSNKPLLDNRLNLGAKDNLKSQLKEPGNHFKNDKVTVTGTLPDETCKVLNIPSSLRNTFPSSDQQHSNVNIYTSNRNESLSNLNVNKSNMATVPYTNNTQNPLMQNNTNPGNNFFNPQQSSYRSCVDSVSQKNNATIYGDSVHKNSSDKVVSVSTNQTNMSMKFQNISSANCEVPNVIVHAKHSENFYMNTNYQHQPNENVHLLGSKFLPNTIPVSDNFCFKAHQNVDVQKCQNAGSKINVPNSSTNQMHFINPQIQNALSNNSNILTQNEIKSSFLQDKNNTKTLNSNSSAHGLIDVKGSNQNLASLSMGSTKSTNCQNQLQVLQNNELSNPPLRETTKSAVGQSCKSTQVTSMQISFASNEKQIEENKQHAKPLTANSGPKKPADELKSICDKSLIQDDSQELSSLFPTERLQSCSESLFRDACTELRDRNLFMPVSHSYMDEMRLNLPHSDFSNDLLSSLQVPNTGQHPESISPTAAFLLAFPLVSTSKTSELITENEVSDSQHATPTTILQIGNIEPTSNELFHQTSLMIENNQNIIKQSKHSDLNKSNNSKQLKDMENFNKFQQMEINELMRNGNFSRTNCKEKKNFVGLGEQDIFYPCTKKKSNLKINNYPLPSTVVPTVQEKSFEFSDNIIRNNLEEDRQINLNEKKTQAQESRNGNTPQNIYNSSSQPYNYSSFSNGNEFMLPHSNYLSTNNQQGTENSKSTPSSSNFNVISWTTASITSNASQMDYTTPYCSYPQKPYSNTNQTKTHKNLPSNFEDQRSKEKSISNLNPLPKFSNFQFVNGHANQDLLSYPHSTQNENTSYKSEPKAKKLKTSSQRAPVNWMTTPDVRPLLPDASTAPVLPDVMFQHQKELDFGSAPNNMVMLNSSSNITPFSISTSAANNTQTFYSNSHFSGVDLQLDFAPFPDISTNKPSRSSTNVSNNQQNPHHYLWSPSKSSIPMLPHIDSHMIPSTLPTLVGDLALGTTTPSGPADTFRNISMPTTPFNIEMPVKKFEKKLETQKQATKTNDKECYPNTERRSGRPVPDYCQKTHAHQGTNTSSSFLSVSQLIVDPAKPEQSPSLRRTTKPSGAKGNNAQKRNTSNQQTDKPKTSNNINSSYHNSNTGMMGQRKFDTGVYQEVHNSNVGFPGAFGNQGGPMPWQGDKSHRSTTHYKVSYSAESLIADQSTSIQSHAPEIPQFPNQYSHPSVMSSASYPSTEFLHQNGQPLEFNQTHQNCFNFSTNSHYSSAPFNPDGDYHLGMDHLFNLNPSANKSSTSCQTSTKDNRSSAKRGHTKQRREEFPPQWTPQVYSPMRPKGPLPPHCPPSTSSPSHQGTTTLTNFNLSTIFPEINDKVGMTGPPPNTFPPAPNFRPH